MKCIRNDSTPVQFHDTGAVVFLYDARSALDITVAEPRILDGFDDDAPRDLRLARVGMRRLLVAYGRRRRGPVAVELSVGRPLTDIERSQARLTAPRVSPLCLPSGRLRIEGYDALAIGADDPIDDGAAVEVPAGEYVVHLYRPADEPVAEAPAEVIVLAPAQETPVPAPPRPFLD